MTATCVRATFAPATFLIVLALAVPLAPARAADLDGDRYAPEPYGAEGYVEEGYDEDAPPPPGRYSEAPPDRYGDRYGDRGEGRGADSYSEGYGPADEGGERPGSIKDGYPVPVPPSAAEGRGWEKAERYDPPPPPRVRADPRYACLESWQIRQQLRRHGWTAIRPLGGDGRIVEIRARRFDSSSVFSLKVERCTGEVLAARPYYLRSFAFGERPWRY